MPLTSMNCRNNNFWTSVQLSKRGACVFFESKGQEKRRFILTTLSVAKIICRRWQMNEM